MEDTWRENQEYALRQTRICFVVMRLFRWLLALLTIVCVGMGIWWLLRGETRAPAALGMQSAWRGYVDADRGVHETVCPDCR